jgi:TolB protein
MSFSADKFLLRPLTALFGLFCVMQAHAQLVIDVEGGDVGATPIAIVPFATPADVSFDVAQIVEADLVRSGLFRAISRTDMLEKPSEPARIDYRNWRAVGMENLVIGSLSRTARGVAVRFFLMDATRGAQLLGFDMPAVGPEQLRVVSHQIADLIYEKLTGNKGYFNTQIAYVTASGFGPGRRFELVVADADGYNPRTIATSKEPLMSPAWSPDGKKLAYVGYERGRSSIYVHTLASGDLKKVVSEKGINGAPAWTPDGGKLVVTLSFEVNPDLYLVDLASGTRRRLTDHYGIDTEATVSPDGLQVAFTSDRGGSPQVYVVSINGGEPRRVTFQGRQNLRPRYSPDGKSLLVVNSEGGRYTIAVVDLRSGSVRSLTDGPLDESPSFAPNGTVVIYATAGRGNPELATVTTDGRVRQRLRQPGEVREPAWGPASH